MVKRTIDLDEAGKARVSAAVRAAEARTSAEIVPVVAVDSGRYDRAEDAVGFVVGLVAVAIVWLVYPEADPHSWAGPPAWLELVALLAAMIVGTGLGTALAVRVPVLRRLALPPSHMQAEVEVAARALFHDHRIHHTQRRDAVMIYVSLFERVVHVLPDQAVEAKLEPEVAARVCATMTAGLRSGDLAAAIVAGVEELGEALAAAMPGDGNDPNEIDDAVILVE